MNCTHSQEAAYIACIYCDIEHAYGEGIAWERERFDRLWQIEKDICKCEKSMPHLKVRMKRTENGIDYNKEFNDLEN